MNGISFIKAFIAFFAFLLSALYLKTTGEKADVSITIEKSNVFVSASSNSASATSVSSSSEASSECPSSSEESSRSSSSVSPVAAELRSDIVGKESYWTVRAMKPKPNKDIDFTGFYGFNENVFKRIESKIGMAEVGDYEADLNEDWVKRLAEKGKKLFVYEWLPAKYHYTDGGEDSDFTKWLLADKENRTLNPSGPFPHCDNSGWDWCDDYYIDYGNESVFKKRVGDIVSHTVERNLDGIFFDWGNAQFLNESDFAFIKRVWEERHPNLSYKEAIAKFYEALRGNGVEVVSNQGFRDGDILVKSVNYDMSESDCATDMYKDMSIDTDRYGHIDSVPYTEYYWYDDKTFDDLVERLKSFEALKKKYASKGFRNFVLVNYLAPKFVQKDGKWIAKKPKNGIYFSYAFAKLIDAIEFSEVPFDRDSFNTQFSEYEDSDVYRYDLGKPLGETFLPIGALSEGYIRFFENGFVLVANAEDAYDTLYLSIGSKYLKDGTAYDLYENEALPVRNGRVTVKLRFEHDLIRGDKVPLGRVYVYTKKTNEGASR